MTDLVSNNPDKIKRKLAAEVEAAADAARAYYPDAERAHGDWDQIDLDGVLWHDEHGKMPLPDGTHMPCPYCRLRRAKLALNGVPHVQSH